MQIPSNRIYRVILRHQVLMCGTLSQCYDAFPTLACVEVGKPTARGLLLECLEW